MGDRRVKKFLKVGFLVFIFSLSNLWAHFGMLIPVDNIISQRDSKKINLQIKFIHPFEMSYMNMEKPKEVKVFLNGKRYDLLQNLKQKKKNGLTYWEVEYKFKEPGDHIFYFEPVPYWEPAEETFIIHYTKTVVNAYGQEEGWDKEIGLKTEIVPLTRPYGLWVGNVFQGIVKVDGKAVPFSTVEVEYYNENKKIKAPKDSFITQVIKADSKGVFTYAMPKAGWWGFAALNEADYKLDYKGKKYPVELGAVIWVKVVDMK